MAGETRFINAGSLGAVERPMPALCLASDCRWNHHSAVRRLCSCAFIPLMISAVWADELWCSHFSLAICHGTAKCRRECEY